MAHRDKKFKSSLQLSKLPNLGNKKIYVSKTRSHTSYNYEEEFDIRETKWKRFTLKLAGIHC